MHYYTKPAHSLFLDTKFKIKYVCEKILSSQERRLDVYKIVDIIQERNIVAEEVYELENVEDKYFLNYLKLFKITLL